jgi:hypothetical protein
MENSKFNGFNKRPNHGTLEKKKVVTTNHLFYSPNVVTSLNKHNKHFNNKNLGALKPTNSIIRKPLVQQDITCSSKCLLNKEIKGECGNVCYRLGDRRIRELLTNLFNGHSGKTVNFSLLNSVQSPWTFTDQANSKHIETSHPFEIKMTVHTYKDRCTIKYNFDWFESEEEYESKKMEWKKSDKTSDDYYQKHPDTQPGLEKHEEQENLKIQLAYVVRKKYHKENVKLKNQIYYANSTHNLIFKIEDACLKHVETAKNLKSTWILSRIPPVIADAFTEFTRRSPFWNNVHGVNFNCKKCFALIDGEGVQQKGYRVNINFELENNKSVYFSKQTIINSILSLRKALPFFDVISYVNDVIDENDSNISLLERIAKWWNIILDGYNNTTMVLYDYKTFKK